MALRQNARTSLGGAAQLLLRRNLPATVRPTRSVHSPNTLWEDISEKFEGRFLKMAHISVVTTDGVFLITTPSVFPVDFRCRWMSLTFLRLRVNSAACSMMGGLLSFDLLVATLPSRRGCRSIFPGLA